MHIYSASQRDHEAHLQTPGYEPIERLRLGTEKKRKKHDCICPGLKISKTDNDRSYKVEKTSIGMFDKVEHWVWAREKNNEARRLLPHFENEDGG